MQAKRKEGETALHFFTKNAGAGSFAACVAESVTLPMDTIKVRLQMQNTVAKAVDKIEGVK